MPSEDKQRSPCLDFEAADGVIHRPGVQRSSAVVSCHAIDSSEMTTECPQALGCFQRPRLGRAVAGPRHDQYADLPQHDYSRHNNKAA